MTMRGSRAALRAAIGLAVVLILCVAVIGFMVARTLPPDRQTLHVPGLGHPVEVTLDAVGVPRIEAASGDDAAAALGFLHARDRMFQMELMRRLGSGRIAELAGSAALPIDRMMRAFGLRRRAEAAYPGLAAADRRLLDAYARGVNAEIASRGRFIAPEFLLIGRPEPWTPVDSLLWGRLMALTLGGNWRTELARLAMSAKLPLDRQLALQPAAAGPPPPQASLAGPGSHGLARLAAELDRRLPRWPAPFTLPEEASDEWAVDGAHSLTGAPLLAGDPHLALGFPAIWYLARITCPGAVLVGATAPGVPFLVIGQNGHIAWTFTSSEADTQDLFIERPGPDATYLTPDGPRPFAVRTETIHVRGAADSVLTIRETRHGPVVSDILPDMHGRLLALSMEALAPTTPEHGDAAAGLIALNDAASVEQAGLAAARSIAPVQNLLVADRSRIALFTTGVVPVRRTGDGSFPQDGADGTHDWVGSASGDRLPHVMAPASGHLLNGNERTAGDDFPVYMGRDWPGDWRARRIRSLLGAREKHDVAGFTRMQVDTASAFAAAILPQLQARAASRPLDGFSARSLGLLRGWDGSMSAAAPQPLIFNAWMQRFAADMLARNDITQPITASWPDLVAFLLTGPAAARCGGDCTPALLRALDEATAQLAASQGNDPAAWRWSRAHRAVFDNALLRAVPLVGRLASRSIAVGGDETSLLRAGNGILGAFDATHGGAYRGVYDLADPERSRFVVTPGQSGNWLSDDAWNLMQPWASGATMTIPRQPGSVSATASLLP
jgi:penicillin amidase